MSIEDKWIQSLAIFTGYEYLYTKHKNVDLIEKLDTIFFPLSMILKKEYS